MGFILAEERQQIIRARLDAGHRVLASDLAREFATSEDTVRRDLRDLAAAGLCRRVYGGALPPAPSTGTLAQRETEAPERKAVLARAAAGLVAPGDVVLIDAGSTNIAIARALPEGRGLTVVTNAPSVASVLAGRAGVALLMIGGLVSPRSGAACDARAVEQLREVRADICFLGACSVDAAAGIGASEADEAIFKRAMLDSSRRRAAAVTTERLGTAASFLVAGLHLLSDLVIEADVPAALRAALAEAGPVLHEAREGGRHA